MVIKNREINTEESHTSHTTTITHTHH